MSKRQTDFGIEFYIKNTSINTKKLSSFWMQIFDDKTQKNSTDKPGTKYEFICI